MSRFFNKYKIETVVGNMSGGKTTDLIHRGKIVEYYGSIDVFYFKHCNDTRTSASIIRSKDGISVDAVSFKSGYDIVRAIADTPPSLILVDETQFAYKDIIHAAWLLRNAGHNIVFYGLALDYRGMTFGYMPHLMAMADIVHYKYPMCSAKEGCYEDGVLPQRLRNGKPDSAWSPTVIIDGEREDITYEPRCMVHHTVPNLKAWIDSQEWT